MEDSKKKTLGIVFLAVVAVGLVLAIIALFTGVVTAEMMGQSESVGLFDEGWETVSEIASPTFATIAVIVTIVGGVVALVGLILKMIGKGIAILNLAGGAVMLIGGILVLVAGLMLAGDMNEPFEALGGATPYSAGMGVWLGFIGGLLGGVAGVMSGLKQFN